ncbi:translation initiation factor IF-2 [Candidatus Woesearchaeota archaeon]|jgi:translation initiation factor 5B|nr:translation initiation factor IF-2 [Candidatus Woesearchaeota archaeon]MBT4835687.1 translation initiation factor IF-2 [Candidatus Woesearchaeota archaeon]MBT6735309.1 translation initiation factor IF-2 [Candidatus Woesearchaeota archaeon]MBT7169481.1 translation initiation factor IF-2 [Candidatus Woesearchaeota archaeon]MBT7474691.1 translation initiation factor IF-2 [Candidatus Woesearchaeota archaeon]
MIRQPICVLLAHVDHGKTSILDRIRGSSLAAKEAGGITQAISAYTIELENIKKICGDLLNNIKLSIPGILFIDSPGHEAFTTLRKRGGNIADIAILVIDVNEGLKPQTIEAIEILKQYKTPFVVAANKIDVMGGWRSQPDKLILQSFSEQSDQIRQAMEMKLYEIVGKLSEMGINSERFDRVRDHTKEIAIIPISAMTGEGFPELLMTITGLAQKFLEDSLNIDVSGQARGTILEVTEEKGMGKTLDTVIYSGSLKQNDKLLIGSVGAPIETKAKCLFTLENNKCCAIGEVHASAAVKISGPGLEDVIPGMPIAVANENSDSIKEEIMHEVEEVMIETDNEGIVIKADTLGSLEALTRLLHGKGIKIKKAGIGNITKGDMSEASSEENALNRLVLGFNVKEYMGEENVHVISNKVIYKIIEDAEKWLEDEAKRLESAELGDLVKPFKIEILKDHVFRQKDPAIVGVEILIGTIKANSPVTKDGSKLCILKSIKDGKDNVNEAVEGKQVAVALTGVTVGRQVYEGDILFSDIPETDFVALKNLKKYLSPKEKDVLREIAELKRRENPTWGI